MSFSTAPMKSSRAASLDADIVIKPADKGSETVIMDRSWYVNECDRQLKEARKGF